MVGCPKPRKMTEPQGFEDRASIAEPDSIGFAQILTGFNDLDELLVRMDRSDLIILGSRPGMGKSALTRNIGINAARNGPTVGIVSMEDDRARYGKAILASEAGIDAHRLRLGLYTEAEEHRMIEANGNTSDMRLFYFDSTPAPDIREIHSKARRLSEQHGLELLVVDCLQLIQGSGGQNRELEIDAIARYMKGMARDLHVPILACSQLSRRIEERPGHRPMLSDLPGCIEDYADIVMFLHREDAWYTAGEWGQHYPCRPYPRGSAEIILAKNHHGPTGSVKLRFRDNMLRFESL